MPGVATLLFDNLDNYAVRLWFASKRGLTGRHTKLYKANSFGVSSDLVVTKLCKYFDETLQSYSNRLNLLRASTASLVVQ